MTSRKGNSSRDSIQGSSQVTDPGGSHRPRSKIGQFLKKLKEDTKKLRTRSKDSRSQVSSAPSSSERPLTTNTYAAPSNVEIEADTESALRGAQEDLNRMHSLSGRLITAASVVEGGPEDLDAADEFQDTYLKPLRIFDDVIGKIADLHPYAKMALGVLSCTAKIILAQADRDAAVLQLLKKLCEVYDFITQDGKLDKKLSMRATSVLGKISKQIRECANFINNYSETSNFWKRLGKNVVSETTNTIQKYNDVLDRLMDNFRHQVLLDVAVQVDDIDIQVHHIGQILELSGMTYAEGAGFDTRKECLQGTRTEILSDITKWVNSTGNNVPRVLWLSGPAGKGKSAIAHTIAKWFNDVGGLGSCYCFDRQREADRRHEKIFSTIARDLADRDPKMRRALAEAVQSTMSLKTTTDIVQQWQKLLIEPLKKSTESSMSTEEPIVIVIDALDESGEAKTREDILRILAGKYQNPNVPNITALPNNFRFIVTSRPLGDIEDEFCGVKHIRQMSMDDIPTIFTERDIRAYVSNELERLNFQNRIIADLAEKADGLFEWARLACGYIKGRHVGLSPIDCYNEVMSRGPAELHGIYRFILTSIMPKDTSTDVQHSPKLHPTALARFRSVMGQILGTAEPLPLASLKAMRRHFPTPEDNVEVELVVQNMGSLLSGTTNADSPIRPLHASFRDFLTDKSSSKEFFVDLSKAQRGLAFASLRVMEHGLRFNICNLKSSYLPNSKDPGLQERVQKYIFPHLSYSSRFWISYVRDTTFDEELAKEVKVFFDHERLFFWIELLALINALSNAVHALRLIPQWLTGHPEFKDVSLTAMDVQRFIQVFGSIILHSTPHLYVSALPFSPANSPLSRTFSARFPNTLRVAAGRDIHWLAVQNVLRGHTDAVNSVSFSPDGTCIVTSSSDHTVRLWDAGTGKQVDGTRIVTGSRDHTVRLWDAGTGKQVGKPLRGHTSSVWSVLFSPDGTRIVTGSRDHTVRLWDAGTGKQVGEPLRGHTSSVNSVSFSPDGTRIVTGSSDDTVRLWDAGTGKQVGEPLRGHTSSVRSVSFSPGGTRIVTGSDDDTVRLWDAGTGKQVGEPLRGHTSSVLSVSFSPDGIRIVTGSQDSTVRLWDAGTGKQVGEPLRGHTSSVWSVSFSPDGTRIVTGSLDRTVRLWDAGMRQSSQQCAESDHPALPVEHRAIEATTTMKSNTWNNHFIRFSSTSIHALCDTYELMEGASHDDHRLTPSTPFFLNSKNGWVVGPKQRLLFWVPPASRRLFYSPGTAMVIPRGGAELDLSRMAHGQHWQKCREGRRLSDDDDCSNESVMDILDGIYI